MSNDWTAHWGDDIYLSWQETILFLLNRPALRSCTKRPNLIEKHCCQLPIVHLKNFVQSFPSDVQNILYKSEAFHLGPFLLQNIPPCPSAVCTCPLPLVGQNLAENEKKQVKVFNLISNTPRPQKKSYSETSRLPCVPKVKTNEVLSSTSEDGREFGGRPLFLSLGLQ